MAEPEDFTARFQRALSRLEKPPPPPLTYDVDSDIPVTLGVETVPPEEEESKPKLAKVTAINLFQQPEAHPVILDLVLLKRYGLEWMEWEPETLVWRIPQDFHTSGVSDLSLEKIQAMKTLHYNDDFWLKWEVFNWCTHPFNNLYANFQIMQVPTTAQLMVAVTVAGMVRTDVPWSEEVLAFMRSACRTDGIFCPPTPLDFLQVGPQNDFLDTEVILKRWPEVLKAGTLPTQDTIADEQLRRMLEAHAFLEASRTRFNEQLPLVPNE